MYIALVALAVAVIGGLLAWYFLYYQHPNKVVRDALHHLSNAQTAGFDGKMQIDSSNSDSDSKVTLDFKGEGDNNVAKIDSKLVIGTGAADITVDADFITKDQTLYMKLNNAKELGQLATNYNSVLGAYFTPLAEKIDGKWIKFAKDDLKALGASEANDPTCTTTLTNLRRMSEQDKQYLSDAFADHQFVTVTKKLPSEKVQGAQSLHYELRFDKEQVRAFEKRLSNVDSFKKLGECFGSNGSSKSESADNLKNVRAEVWIDQRTHKPRKFMVYFEAEDTKFTLNSLLDLDKSVSVTEPKDATSFTKITEELRAELESQLGGSLQQQQLLLQQ